jgi:Calx-beta domain/Dockerin type I domain/HYDIN/CFA65/VesB-like, Ig-like domain
MARQSSSARRSLRKIARFDSASPSFERGRRLRLEALETRQMLAFSIGTEFTGGSISSFVPPDTMGTVGQDFIVEMLNGRAAVYDKNGVLQIAATLDEFWISSGVTPVGSSFDPRVLYDAASGHYFAAAVDNGGAANSFLVAVSNTTDLIDGWTGFQIDSDTDDSHWADFPMLGLNNDVVTVSANMFGLNGEATNTSFLVIPKNDLLAAVPTVANATLFENISLSETGFAPQPVFDLDNGSLPLPVLSEFDKNAGSLKAWTIGGTPSAPTLNTAGGSISVTPRGAPPAIDQPGSKADIDAGDSRFSGNVIRQQIPGRTNPSLWGVHSVDIGGRAAIEWYEINAATNAVLQSGTISDPSLAFNYPSIAVNDFGDVVIGFSGGDPSTFMSTYVAVGQTTAGITTFDPVMQTKAGVAGYEILDNVGRNRWGDYSATVVDPTDDRHVWTFQEFASGVDKWSIRVTEVVIVGPLDISIGNDVSVLEGDSGTVDAVFAVTLTGKTSETVTVSYSTVDVTAVAPDDYEAQSGTLMFRSTDPLTQFITVRVSGDVLVEPNETFLVRLTDPSIGSLGRSEAVGTIVNDDVDVSISDATLVEGNSGTRNMVFTLSVFGSLKTNVSVTYTTLNDTADGATDYLPRAGAVTLSPQATTGTVTVPIVGDTLNEGPEQLFVVLLDAQGIRIDKGIGIGTIIDDDSLPAFYVDDVQITSNSAGAASAVFTIALDAASGRDASVEYATADGGAVDGVDYTGQSGMLTFPAGMTTAQVTVPVMTSADPSPDKTFFLNLSSPQHATVADPQGAATIVFADPPPDQWIIDNGDAAFTRSGGGWTNVTNTLAYGLDYEYHAAGSGNAAATWTFTALANGSYEVFTRWTAFVNRATNAPYAIIDGSAALGAALGTVQVNQQAAPAGDFSDGVTWQSLGTYSIGSNTLTVRLSNNANGLVIADAVRIVADGIPPQVAEINVSGSQQSIGTGDMTPTENDDTEFGAVDVGTESPAHVFTITNTGNAVLALTGSPPVTISGADAADFVVTTQPAGAVQPGGSTTFQIEFHPTASELRQAVVTIANNDDSENPYTFMVQGTGMELVQPFAHNDAFPQDVNADSRVSPIDVLIVVNHLLARNAEPAAAPLAVTSGGGPTSSYCVDVNADGRLSPIDVLMVINYLLSQQAAAPSAAPLADTSAGTDPALVAVAVDRAIAQSEVSPDEALAEPLRLELAPTSAIAAGDKSTAQPPTALADAAVSASFAADDEESDEAASAATDLVLAFLDD